MITILITIVLTILSYTSGNLQNTWYWTIASGNPNVYSVEISYDDGVTWKVLENISANEGIYEHEGHLCRFWTYTSSKEEIYCLRVRGADAAGNWGPYSEISDPLTIILSKAPGQPKLYQSLGVMDALISILKQIQTEEEIKSKKKTTPGRSYKRQKTIDN